MTGAYDEDNDLKIKKKVESDATKFYRDQLKTFENGKKLETFEKAQAVFIEKDKDDTSDTIKIVYLAVVVSRYQYDLKTMTTIANSQPGVVEEPSVKCTSAIHHLLNQNSIQSICPQI